MPTIALVDVDHNVLSSVSIALKAEGYRVATYTDGASALDSFQTAPPHLAILDIKMPYMGGVETLRQLRAKSNLPVIFLTSTEVVSEEVLAFQVGADDCIRKPFSQRLLVERVKALLRRASSKDGTLSNRVGNFLERGALRMDVECHTCTWKNHRVETYGERISDIAHTGQPSRRGEEPECIDGGGLRQPDEYGWTKHRQPHQAAAPEVYG